MDRLELKEHTLLMSSEGLQRIVNSPKTDNSYENIIWTSDYRTELPIRVAREGLAAERPITLNQAFVQTVEKYGSKPAMSEKVDGKWLTQNF